MSADEIPAKRGRKEPKPAPPTENPDPARCNFYVAKKNRFCRTEKRAGYKYCHTHQAELDVDPNNKRIPCPLNGNHTIYEKDLQRHLKVCPDGRHDPAKLPYYTKRIHFGRGGDFVGGCGEPLLDESCWKPTTGVDEAAAAVAQAPAATAGENAEHDLRETNTTGKDGKRLRNHRDLTDTGLSRLVSFIESKYDECVVPQLSSMDDFLAKWAPETRESYRTQMMAALANRQDEADENPVRGVEGTTQLSSKHAPQHVGILAALDATGFGLVDCVEGTSPAPIGHIVEMGAGKGGLALAAHAKLSGRPRSSTNKAHMPTFVVVDRGGFRRKADGRVRNEEIPFERLRIDIQDFELAKVESMGQRSSGENETSTPGKSQFIVLGKHLCGACTDFALSASTVATGDASCECIVIATCCHHRCELQHLCPIPDGNQQSPATASHPFFGLNEEEFRCVSSMTSWAVSGAHAVSSEKQEIGYKCKRLIDYTRLKYLESLAAANGPSAAWEVMGMVQYCDRTVSGENVVIVARKRSPANQ